MKQTEQLQKALEAIKAAKRELEEYTYPSREKSLALTKLDEALLWAGAIPEVP